ncbi:MAG: radical SAM protein [Gammaproteobacteria bacterium]|nr:radical SAM protein [Gammaproteobacteria bacterium]
MFDWMGAAQRVEALEDIELDSDLIQYMESHWSGLPDSAKLNGINFYTPTFKTYLSSELSACSSSSAWPAVSITGAKCKLQCDHCKAKILEPMIAAETPEELWRVVNRVIEQGGRGMLITGGSNHRNEVEYDSYYSTIRRIKDEFPFFKIAMHTALVNDDIALSMEQSGIDAAMMDVIGAQETITQVYHLKRTVDDFEATLASLVNTKMKVVPHIVIGLHYGQLLGEWQALKMLQRYTPDAVVLVVVMPQYAPEKRPFKTPDTTEVGRFFMDAREALPNTPLLLGCARPPGLAKVKIDSYAVMAGMSGIAHPAEGVVELAARLERQVKVTPACCSIAVGEEVMSMDETADTLELNLEQVLAHERANKRPAFFNRGHALQNIKIVSG